MTLRESGLNQTSHEPDGKANYLAKPHIVGVHQFDSYLTILGAARSNDSLRL
jgi:hypothetical protein